MISHYKKIIGSLVVLLLLMVVGAILFFDVQVIELVELISLSCFFCAYLIFNTIKDKMIFWAFISYFVIDILGLFNDNNYFNQIIPIIKVFIYLIFTLRIFNKFKLIRRDKYVLILFSVMITLNVSLLYVFVWGFSAKPLTGLDRLLFFFYGLILIIIGVMSMNYNFRYSSKRSLFFLCFIFASIISDTSWFIGFFLDSELSYYIDSVFYIITLFFMVKYAVETKAEDDILLLDDDIK